MPIFDGSYPKPQHRPMDLGKPGTIIGKRELSEVRTSKRKFSILPWLLIALWLILNIASH